MKKHYALSLLMASFLLFLTFHGVHAQSSDSVSGDGVCGATAATKCGLTDFKKIVRSVWILFVSVGSMLLVVAALYRLLVAEWATRVQGNAGARMQALGNIWNGLVGILIIVGVMGGFFLLALKLLGAQSWTTNIFQFFSDAFVEHAYAADTRLLPNPLGAYNFFDLIVAVLNLIVKFFIYPAIVVLWVWSGFQFVYSQGNPAGLQKAKSWILWSFLITVAAFTLQGFTLALRNTMMNAVPNNPAAVQAPPADQQQGGTPTASQPVTSCQGQNDGTPCTVAGRKGTCTFDETGSTFQCFVTPGQ